MTFGEELLKKWVQRDQQIFVAEALAILAASIHLKPSLAGRDVIWFVDNVSALAVMVKGNTAQYDAGIVCATTHLLWAAIEAKVWFEWVVSDDNPSDGLSRLGLQDAWTLAQLPKWACEDIPPPAFFKLSGLPLGKAVGLALAEGP